MLFNGRNDAIKFFEGYSSMILEATKKLQKNQQQVKDTSKQMLQRLPTALAQVKAGNNS